MYTIKWSKEYHEDIGEQDENGFFDYAYRYFIYFFHLPNKITLVARQYIDSIDECAFYLVGSNAQRKKQFDDGLQAHLSSIAEFMSVNQEVKRFSYFDGEYVPFELKKEKGEPAICSFLEIAAGR